MSNSRIYLRIKGTDNKVCLAKFAAGDFYIFQQEKINQFFADSVNEIILEENKHITPEMKGIVLGDIPQDGEDNCPYEIFID